MRGRAAKMFAGIESEESESLDIADTFDRAAARQFVEVGKAPWEPVAHLFAALRQGALCLPISGNTLMSGGRKVWRGSPREWEELSDCGVVREGNRAYLPRGWQVETAFLEELQRLTSCAPYPPIAQNVLDSALVQSPLNPGQQRAVAVASAHAVSAISGGPGTGKTFTAGHLVRILQGSGDHFLEVAVAAPTGKAAARLQQSLGTACGVQATTLHRLLKLRAGRIPTRSVLTADVILVDESSMLDADTMVALLRSVKEGARLVLMGDHHQLPPVESGAFYGDLITAGILGSAAIQLKGSQRTGNPQLLALAEAAREGNARSVLTSAEVLAEDPTQVHRWLYDTYGGRLLDVDSIDPTTVLAASGQRRLLSPLKHGPLGTEHLNRLCYRWHTAVVTDVVAVPIMVVRNSRHLELYNGDTGIALVSRRPYEALFPFRDGEQAYFLEADGSLRQLPASLLPGVELGYCLSVHKSQGSEWEEVVLIMPEGSEVFGRPALYTGITRAREQLRLLGHPKALEEALRSQEVRLSGVAERWKGFERKITSRL